jgi:hypothetical protein
MKYTLLGPSNYGTTWCLLVCGRQDDFYPPVPWFGLEDNAESPSYHKNPNFYGNFNDIDSIAPKCQASLFHAVQVILHC